MDAAIYDLKVITIYPKEDNYKQLLLNLFKLNLVPMLFGLKILLKKLISKIVFVSYNNMVDGILLPFNSLKNTI